MRELTLSVNSDNSFSSPDLKKSRFEAFCLPNEGYEASIVAAICALGGISFSFRDANQGEKN